MKLANTITQEITLSATVDLRTYAEDSLQPMLIEVFYQLTELGMPKGLHNRKSEVEAISEELEDVLSSISYDDLARVWLKLFGPSLHVSPAVGTEFIKLLTDPYANDEGKSLKKVGTHLVQEIADDPSHLANFLAGVEFDAMVDRMMKPLQSEAVALESFMQGMSLFESGLPFIRTTDDLADAYATETNSVYAGYIFQMLWNLSRTGE